MKKPIIDIKRENLYIDRDENREILDEAENSNDRTSALKLHCLMGFLSDDLFMCGWLIDIDKEMFHLLEERRRITKEVNYVDIDGFANVSVQTVELLRELITKSGGFWNGKHQFVFIDLDENSTELQKESVGIQLEAQKDLLQNIVENQKKQEKSLIQKKQVTAENYLQTLKSELFLIELKQLEERVQYVIKECYRVDSTTGYPLYSLGDLYECSVFNIDFTFPKAKQFWDLVLELFELSNSNLKIQDKLGYWLSSNLFQTINISDARLIKLPHLKLLFEFLSKLNCRPSLTLLAEKDYYNIVQIGKMQLRFIYEKE